MGLYSAGESTSAACLTIRFVMNTPLHISCLKGQVSWLNGVNHGNIMTAATDYYYIGLPRLLLSHLDAG